MIIPNECGFLRPRHQRPWPARRTARRPPSPAPAAPPGPATPTERPGPRPRSRRAFPGRLSRRTAPNTALPTRLPRPPLRRPVPDAPPPALRSGPPISSARRPRQRLNQDAGYFDPLEGVEVSRVCLTIRKREAASG